MKQQTDKIAENDYSIAYFHNGLNSKVYVCVCVCVCVCVSGCAVYHIKSFTGFPMTSKETGFSFATRKSA